MKNANKWLAVLAACVGMVSGACAQTAPRAELAQAKSIVAGFAAELKGELGKAMKAGGPLAAVAVCHSKAPEIAAKHAQETGWSVGRTSLKLRNQANAPDAWELDALQTMADQVAAGAKPTALVRSEVVEENGAQVYRFMAGIIMPAMADAPCLRCHGTAIAPDLRAKLDTLYPKDQAYGYEAGQLRGAFTLKKQL